MEVYKFELSENKILEGFCIGFCELGELVGETIAYMNGMQNTNEAGLAALKSALASGGTQKHSHSILMLSV